MGISYRPDYLEAEPLKLAAEHFPLPCSLRERVLQRYVDNTGEGTGLEPMDLQELIGYLHNTPDLALSPMQSVLAQTESIGDPALPTAEQAALLQWAGEAFDTWERDFPLEQPLCTQMRRLKPLVASLAIVDPDFLTPGGHPLHLVIDKLQSAAVGWQASLGRAGQALETSLVRAIDEALTWFDTPDTDLAALAARVTATTERDLARASRMAQRLVEAEEGRIRTADARRLAALMINAALQQFPAPPGIGKFLKGAWYDSAQLVLLKFGEESEQWAQMSATTCTLLNSVQAREDGEAPGRRQQLFETVTQLPRELRRWLLSLQHDGDAVAQALGVVEYAHMQILRKQPLETEPTDLIPVAAAAEAAAAQDALESISTGQWFSVEPDTNGPLRARLVLRMEAQGQLLFANQAGVKVLQQSFEEFSRLLDSGKVAWLDSGASFSRCLAWAAGIQNTADLDTLQSAAVLQARREEAELHRLAQEKQQQEQERLAQLTREREEQERLQREEAAASRREQAREHAEHLALEQEQDAALQREWDDAQRRKLERMQLEQPTTAPPAPAAPPADAIPNPGLTQRAPEPAASAVPAADTAVGAPAAPGHADPKSEAGEPALALPMGAWLGFHDGDTPLLAKLAVHDREKDNYIFVNRNGIKMRDLNSQALLRLIEKGLVDILETRSNFREQISRAKGKTDD